MTISHGLKVSLMLLPLMLAPSVTLAQSGMDAQRLARIPERMQEFVDDGMISGAVMLVARHGDVVLHEAVGHRDTESRDPMRRDTIFQIQSMTKPVTALAAMILLEEGLLRLNDPVEMYLPEFRGQTLASRSAGVDEQTAEQQPVRPITIRDLLTHTSGMPHGHHAYATAPAARTLEEVVASNARQPLVSEPGTTFLYSSLAMETLGRLIEVGSGRRYEQFLQERIFAPLGMKDSFFIAQPTQCARIAAIYERTDGTLTRFNGDPCSPFTYPNPAGGMFSTAADMFAFHQMTLQGGTYVRAFAEAFIVMATAAMVN